MTGHQSVCLHAKVDNTVVKDGDLALLQLDSAAHDNLDSTSTRTWQGLKQPLTLEKISHQLQVEFAVESTRAYRSMLALVNELLQHKLVQRPV
jgi:hypothetical protein